MKFLLSLIAAVTLAAGARAATAPTTWSAVLSDGTAAAAGLNATTLDALDLEGFLDLTPKKYRVLTGERLGIKGSLALKAAQKQVKKQLKDSRDADVPKGLYVVLAIFGWGWLAMGLMDDFEGNNWWIGLLLTIACVLPGIIFSFVKMSDYY